MIARKDVAIASRLSTQAAGGIEAVARETSALLRDAMPELSFVNAYAFSRSGRLNRLPIIGDIIAALLLFVRTLGTSIVFVHGAEYAWPFILTRRKVIVVWHGSRITEISFHANKLTWIHGIMRAYASLVESIAVRAHINVSVSPVLTGDLVSRYGKRNIVTIPNGSRVHDTVAHNVTGFNVVWVGTSPYKKGLDIAIEACRLARQSVPDLCLTIVGTTLEPALLEPWIICKGLVSAREMPSVWASASMYLCTSRYEACSMALLEALSMGVMTVGGPAVQWMLSDPLLSVSSLDPDAFAIRIVMLAGDPSRAADAARRCRSISDQFSPESMLARYIKILRPLIDEKRVAHGATAG